MSSTKRANQSTPRVSRLSFSIAAALSAAAVLSINIAHAQTAKPAEKARAGELETITVTAERRAENIQDVPSSISALKGDTLDAINSGGQDIRMLAARVPSLNIESSFGRAFPRFYIRGLGNGDFDLNASQPVSLVYDDVVQENPILKGFPIFDLEQIEVLRGPQGTLFGRNSPAGVIKFESAKPRFANEAYVNISHGKYNTSNLEGALNLPLNKEVAIRLSTQLQGRDGWVINQRPGPTGRLEGYRDNAFRLQTLYKPNDSFSALFNFHNRDLSGSARVFRANIIKPGTNDFVANFDPSKVFYDGRNQQDVTNNGGSMRLKWEFANTTLHSITGLEKVTSFSRGDIDGGFSAVFMPGGSTPGVIPFTAESADGLPNHRQLTQEFRLESKGKGMKWLIGAYYFDEEIDIDSINYDSLAPGNPRNGFAKQNQKNKAYALFGSVNTDLTSTFNLRAGLRYTNDKKDFYADRLIAPPFSPTFIGRRTTNTSASNVSGDIAGTLKLSADTNVYARVATGFRAPSIQGRLLFGDQLSVANSEKVTSVEAGIKTDLFNKRARLAANVFSYEVKDQQITAVGGATNFNRLLNAAKTSGSGAELDLQAYLTDTLLLTVSGSLNDTKIKDGSLAIQACGAPCTVLDPAAVGRPGTFSINGNPLPQAPKYVANVTLRYSIPVAGGEYFVYTDMAYRSKINFFLYESREYTGKALTETGLRFGYKWADGKYEAAIYGRNITNQIRVVGGIDFNNLTGFINEPRFWGAQFKANF
jgi:iron complex outermembrane receptor protein